MSPESRQSVLKDVLTVYGGIGKSIIFTQTKREADAVTAAISSTHPCEVSAAIAPLHTLRLALLGSSRRTSPVTARVRNISLLDPFAVKQNPGWFQSLQMTFI